MHVSLKMEGKGESCLYIFCDILPNMMALEHFLGYKSLHLYSKGESRIGSQIVSVKSNNEMDFDQIERNMGKDFKWKRIDHTQEKYLSEWYAYYCILLICLSRF